MITPGRLPLVGFRNAPFVYSIALPGLDLRGADIDAQIRLVPDTPGAPLATFFIQNDFSTINQLPYSNLTLSIGEAAMAAFPRTGELGSPAQFAWDLTVTPPSGYKSVYLLGSLYRACGSYLCLMQS
jgi:hypothetical protein